MGQTHVSSTRCFLAHVSHPTRKSQTKPGAENHMGHSKGSKNRSPLPSRLPWKWVCLSPPTAMAMGWGRRGRGGVLLAQQRNGTSKRIQRENTPFYADQSWKTRGQTSRCWQKKRPLVGSNSRQPRNASERPQKNCAMQIEVRHSTFQREQNEQKKRNITTSGPLSPGEPPPESPGRRRSWG